MRLKLRFVLLFLTIHCFTFAQFDFPSLSPKGNISQIVGDTKMEVEYERPSVRGRKILGELVPWNKVWRTGAGKCTKIGFDKAVKVGNQAVPAGTYSLFTIPNKEEWVVIFNSDTTLYGSYDYDQKKDMARFVVKPKKSERFYETLTIDIDLIPNNARMYISWADVQIDFKVETYSDSNASKYISDELMTGKSRDVDALGLGAEYLLMSNTNFDDALELAQRMIDNSGNEGWGRNIKMQVFEKLHRYDEALTEAKRIVEISKGQKYEKEENRIREVQHWQNQVNRIENKKTANNK